jgi:hypothetical protein
MTKAQEIIIDCQKILAEYLPPGGPDANETISKLLAILDGLRAREALRE